MGFISVAKIVEENLCARHSQQRQSKCIHLHKQELGTGRSLFDDIADCSCGHMNHVTSVLEHRSPKCKGPGSRGRGGGVLFNHEREREGEQTFRPVIV